MGNLRNDEWDDNFEVYTDQQVEGVLGHAGVEIVTETATHFLCYCPFHGNTDSPAFAVNKVNGLYMCFNPSCQETGTLNKLLNKTMGYDVFKSLRTIIKYKNKNAVSLEERLKSVMLEAPDFVEFNPEALAKMAGNFKGSIGEEYMLSRGFTSETLEYFSVGFSKKKDMVVVPMHDPKGMPIGLIGRSPSHTDKRFKNSTNLPKSKTAWNFHRAKRHGDTIIICEASYDAMRIHQAGFPNVVALLGGHITDHHVAQLGKHFSTGIIMTDYDKKQYRPNCRMCHGLDFKYSEVRCKGHRPGRDLGRSIASKLPNKKILWATYDDTCVYPHNAKDATDMTDAEIRQCLNNAISNIEYTLWGFEEFEVVAATA